VGTGHEKASGIGRKVGAAHQRPDVWDCDEEYFPGDVACPLERDITIEYEQHYETQDVNLSL
jgi:hypothetical protein